MQRLKGLQQKLKLLILTIAVVFSIDVFLFFFSHHFIVLGPNRPLVLNVQQYNDSKFYTQYEFNYDKKLDFLNRININKNYRHNFEGAVALREYLLSLPGSELKKGRFEKIKLITPLLGRLIKGDRLKCLELSYLYGFLLDSLGFKTRLVDFSRSIFVSPNTHAVIELFDEDRKKWILSDPLYNASFIAGDVLLSVMELNKMFHSNRIKDIKILKGKAVHYNYQGNLIKLSEYASWLNIIYIWPVVGEGGSRHLLFYPPFRYFNKLHSVYTIEDSYRTHKFVFFMQDIFAAIILLILPLTIITLALLCIFILLHLMLHPMR